MRRRRARLAAPRRQRGVALIIALILVALATILATKLSFDGWLERRRTIGIIATEQAYQFGTGAEALAADVLSQIGQTPQTPQNGTGQPQNPITPGQNANQVTLAQPWAQPTQPMPITSPDDPEAEPIGSLQGVIEDMQGRFNLNNLAHMIMQNNQAVEDPQPLEQFQRLLVSVGLEAKWAGIARDWIDADDQPGQPDGAEDSVYTMQNPPYRTGNWPMMSPAELMNLPGFGADRYRKIAPYVTALPSAVTKINICTAPGPVLESLAETLSGEYSSQVLANGRQTGCFPDIATLTAVLGPNAPSVANRFTDTSQFFRLTTRVTLGTTEFTLYSLLYRGPGGKVTPLLRSFGTP
ncbi:MAG TPA: type II secretion system minor pseudopilin GspK [Steroidobacteraceae bacterium]|jgi:general secretion pathway protein K|nr:type II secretion system minor pseudopilin GspK [Steroidobacteraceae bacterium]